MEAEKKIEVGSLFRKQKFYLFVFRHHQTISLLILCMSYNNSKILASHIVFLMKLKLNTIYYFISDNRSKEEINLFLQYTKIRSFRYRIWRIIPINISLPLELVNLCITYVIVVINFTHLYG